MAISDDEIYLLNHMNATAAKVQLGTLIENAEGTPPEDINLDDGLILVGGGDDLAAAVALSGAITITNAGVASIAEDAVSLEHLDSDIAPSHVLKYAGEHTTAGGDATESITATGAAATDLVVINVKTAGAVPCGVVAAAAGTNVITVTMSDDPSTDHVLQWFVYRAAV